MEWIIIVILFYLVISYIFADEFMDVAAKKGYFDRKYFWYCFLFGIAGYLLVIALPPKENSMAERRNETTPEKTRNRSKTHEEYIGDIPKFDLSEINGLKQCPNCGTCHDSAFEICPSCQYEYHK